MKKRLAAKSLTLLAALIVAIPLLFGGSKVAFAATADTTDQSTPRSGNIFVEVSGTRASQEDALYQINLIRYHACRNQEYAVEHNANSPTTTKLKLDSDWGETPTYSQLQQKNGDYVPLKWSEDLEKLAEIRSTEAEIKKGHQRPNSEEELCYNMVSPSGLSLINLENLYWTSQDSSDVIDSAIDSWKAERSYYLNKTGTYGHYAMMIDMQMTYIGIADFSYTKDALGGTPLYKHAVALEACGTPSNATLSETQRNKTGSVTQLVEVDNSTVQKLTLQKEDGSALEDTEKLCPGKTLDLRLLATILPVDTRTGNTQKESTWPVNSKITWTSSDTSAATVDANGKVTAKKSGTTTITASSAGQTATLTIEVGHKLKKHEKVNPTCTETGTEAYWTCSNCGKMFSDAEGTNEITKVTTIAALGHDWGEGTVTKKATCSSKGVKTFTCKRCKKTKTEEIAIDQANHENIVTKNQKDATCTEAGYTGDQVCTACGKTVQQGSTIAALGHEWDNGKVTKKATCSTKGEKIFTCGRCEKTKTEEIALDPANHEKVVTNNKKDATCTEAGYTGDQICEACGKTVQQGSTTPAKGHKLTKHDAVPATCTETGTKEYWECSVCHKKFSNAEGTAEVTDADLAIPAEDHQYSSEWKSDGTNHWRECEVCGEKIDVEAHTYGEWKHTGSHTHVCSVCGYSETEPCEFGAWTVTKAPTATETGLKVRTCEKCGFQETAAIAATGSADQSSGSQNGVQSGRGKGGTVVSGNNGSKTPRTDDDSNAALYLLLALAASGVTGLVLKKKSENR